MYLVWLNKTILQARFWFYQHRNQRWKIGNLHRNYDIHSILFMNEFNAFASSDFNRSYKVKNCDVTFSFISGSGLVRNSRLLIVSLPYRYMFDRPIIIIVLFVMVLFMAQIKLCKYPNCDANKSTNRLDMYAPKVE
jgi:hypothetical protein